MAAGGGCLFTFIGIFFWPLLIVALPLFIIGGLGAGLGYLLDKHPRYKCSNCGWIKTVSVPSAK